MLQINGTLPGPALPAGDARTPAVWGPTAPPGMARRPGSDDIRGNWWNPPPTAAPASDGLGGILQRLLDGFGKQLGALLGQPQPGSGTDTAFSSATLGSTGDPHLSLTGAVLHGDGTSATIADRFDAMQAQSDLFSTTSFGDGFVVSTQPTAPGAGGVTYNQVATAQMNGGLDAVSLAADGTLNVTSGGVPVALPDGTATSLSGGATVSRAADGSVTIGESNASGGVLSTTFAATGSGVDVTAQAQDVALGGALVDHALSSATA